MGDLLGSPRVATLFWGLAGYHSGLPLVVPMGSALPIAIGAGRSSIRSPDRKIRVVEIARLGFFPVFCRMEDPIVRGRSAETAGFLDGRWAVVHGAGDNMTAAIRNDGFKGTST